MNSRSLPRSETVEQQAYEEQIYKKQYSHEQHPYTTTDPVARIGGGEHAPSLRGKLKRFYNTRVRPSFPEANADLHIIKNLTKVEHAVTKDLHDSRLFPEIEKVAEVRRGLELNEGEQKYLVRRKAHIRDHFAKYIGVPPEDVSPEDIPTVSFGGSGGGFRAMIGVMGYCAEMQRTGLWDLLTYVSGVSGSCWSLAAYYTYGNADWGSVIEHCKKRLSPHHPLSAEAIRSVLLAPGGAHYALGPVVQKHHSGLRTVAMDLYSVFITGYIFLQNDPVLIPGQMPTAEVGGYHRDWFRWSNALRYIEDGNEPMPILTAIRHERPWKDWVDKSHPFKEADLAGKEHSGAEDAWFQWFEMTPYEIGCDELQVWCPTWGFGRPFEEGKSKMQLPEQSLALLFGLCTSAPAGPLTSYPVTVKRNLPPGFIGNSVHKMAVGVSKIWGKQGTEEFQQHHPLHACNEHNFMYRLSHVEPGQSRPPGIENSPRIHLIDSGMDNNCPTYVLLHPSREADVIINMDASSDVQKNTFQERVDQIGSRRGLKYVKRHRVTPSSAADPTDSKDRFQGMYAQIYDGTQAPRPPTVIDSYGATVTNPPAPVCHHDNTMVYMPLLPNERAVPDFDPSTAKFSGSYNLVWTPEQVEMLVKVCYANFRDGEETVKEVLRETWLKRKEKREAREKGVQTERQN